VRTTIDFPDPLLRRLKSRAALEGTTLKALVQSFVEHGLDTPLAAPRAPGRSALPSISTGRRLTLQDPSNAGLFELLDEA